VRAHKSPELDKLVEKHWGKVGVETAGEKISRIRSIANILRGGPGDSAKGKELFTKTCATCHVLFGEGNKVGPELTGADRKNLDLLLMNVIDPSAVIRPEFVAYNVLTKDGRALFGLIVEATPTAITLVDGKNEKVVVPRDKIDEMSASAVSLMPDKLLDTFDEQMLRDFFAYVRGDGPPGGKPK
jgi:putative heme-binding domain-containing protein